MYRVRHVRPLTALVAMVAAAWLASHASATLNIISDQIVDGNNMPYQKPGGGNATLADLGLGLVPMGDNPAVKVVPWATLPGDIGQMQHRADKLYFSTVQGQIWEYDLEGNQNATAFLNVDALRAPFSTSGPTSGQGLRGFAFHPAFDANGLLYTMHREDASGGAATHGGTLGQGTAIGHYVLAEWNFNNLVSGNPSFRSLMRIAYPATDHVGSQINFNPVAAPGDPDYGNLYVAFGDGGGSGSGSNTVHNIFGYGQNMQAIQSSLIRINPLQDGANPYSIPSDNPYLSSNDPTNAVLDEIYAKGFRNPTSMLFDQLTGALFSNNISQNTIEEVNLIQPGHNYGWGQVEGTWLHTDLTDAGNKIRYLPLGDGTDVTALSATYIGKDRLGNPVTFTNINRLNDGYTSPIAQFSHDGNQLDAANQSAAITGTVYRGDLAPALEGLFLFSSLSQDEIYYVSETDLVNDESPAQPHEMKLVDQSGIQKKLWQIVGAPSSSHRVNHRFGQDANGDIYIISKHNDTIYRLESPTLPSILGDVNIDGIVDAEDIADFIAGWLQSAPVGPQSWALGDLNLSGANDLRDVYLMHEALVAQGSAFPFAQLFAEAPEPQAAQLVATIVMAAAGLRAKGRRRA